MFLPNRFDLHFCSSRILLTFHHSALFLPNSFNFPLFRFISPESFYLSAIAFYFSRILVTFHYSIVFLPNSFNFLPLRSISPQSF
jgi:hypothetical protein